MKFSQSVFILILLLLHAAASSQNTRRFRHLDVSNGLAHTDAMCLEQDEKGFIWIGTNSGLQRFDGQKLKTYINNTSALYSVYNNRISSLKVQGDLLWIGSEGGLTCFDLRSERFIPLSYSGYATVTESKTITAIHPVGSDIWMISSGKLLRCSFDEKSSTIDIKEPNEIIRNFPAELLGAVFLSLESDKSNILWAGTNNGLAVIIKNADGYIFQQLMDIRNGTFPLTSVQIGNIFFKEEKLWIRSEFNIQVLSLDSDDLGIKNLLRSFDLRSLTHAGTFDNVQFSGVITDNDDNLWIASNIGLIYVSNPLSEHPSLDIFRKNLFDLYSLGGNNVSDLLVDRSDCLWISAWGGGVSCLDLEQKKFNTLTINPEKPLYSLKGPFVRAIAEDSKGMIWIGLRTAGINIFDPETGRCYGLNELFPGKFRLQNNEIRSIVIHNNKVYIGTASGMDILNMNDMSIIHILPGDGLNNVPASPVFAIEIDESGYIWAATWGGGLCRIRITEKDVETTRVTTETTPFGLSSNVVNDLVYDSKRGELLASTSKGLNRIVLDDYGNISNILYYRINQSDSSLTSEYLWPLLKENDSVLWIGTLGGGLNRMVIYNYRNSNGPASYSASSFSNSTGALGGDVESILSDNNGNLWIGGKGISKVNIKTMESLNFDSNDGLQSNGFKIGSAYRAKEGTLYFGGISGLNFFRAEEIRSNPIKPSIALTGLNIHNIEVKTSFVTNGRVILPEGIQYADMIELKSSENDFSLSFASLHFANPDKCRFKYMLEGYETSWNYVNSDYPVATYSNLKYGNYVFKLDGTNNDGLWSGSPVNLKIRILPPWWRTWWAHLSYIIILIAAVYGIYFNFSNWIKLRNNLKLAEAEEKHNEELHQMKLQFFTNISHEFKTPLTLILSPAERLLSETISEDEQIKLLKLISGNADRLLNLVNELMDFRKAEMGKMTIYAQEQDITKFTDHALQQFVPLAKQKDVDLEIKFDAEIMLWFDTEMMSKILFNLFSNAIKYTNSNGHVRVEVFSGNVDSLEPYFRYKFEEVSDNSIIEYCFIKVHDSGIGISEASISHIFERYYQINKAADRHLGTGVGLSLLKSLVKLHHGYIMVTSERQIGTEIIVGFPLGDQHLSDSEKVIKTEVEDNVVSEPEYIKAEPDSDSTEEQADSVFHENNKEIPGLLIVEDDDELRELLRDHFGNRYRIFGAENGQLGFDTAVREMPSLIISDVIMPVMNGFEMCILLKEDIRTCHIPIIFLTSRSSIESQIEGIEMGAVEYIPKPFNNRLLDAKVNCFIDNLERIKDKYASDIFGSTREIARNQNDQRFIESLFAIIDENIEDNDFSVNEICRRMGMGRSNLYKKIKSLAGQSLGEFIRSYRLKKAAKILLTEDITVSEVIYRVGMSSHSYFTKSFKSQFNLTPSEFVQKNSIRSVKPDD